MTTPGESRIDFIKETADKYVETIDCDNVHTSHYRCQNPSDHLLDWARSIAARVEEQAIQRCAHSDIGINRRVLNIERLYSTAPDEKGKS